MGVIGKKYWEYALYTAAHEALPQNLAPGLIMAGDVNGLGMEPAAISGIYAANKILGKTVDQGKLWLPPRSAAALPSARRHCARGCFCVCWWRRDAGVAQRHYNKVLSRLRALRRRALCWRVCRRVE